MEAADHQQVLRVRQSPDFTDQPGYTAILGATYGCADQVGKGRPCAVGYRAGIGRRNNPPGCNRFDRASEYLEALCAVAQQRRSKLYSVAPADQCAPPGRKVRGRRNGTGETAMT